MERLRPGNPLPGAPLRFRLRFVVTLRLRLGAGSGLPSAGLFGMVISVLVGRSHQVCSSRLVRAALSSVVVGGSTR